MLIHNLHQNNLNPIVHAQLNKISPTPHPNQNQSPLYHYLKYTN